jgi:putative peptidoglycan lipid II flippase
MSFPVIEQKTEVSGSANKKIFWAAAIIAPLSVLSTLASTGKELVVAKWFGRSDAVDAFLIAFLLPSFVVTLLAESFNAALIPTFIQVRETEGRDAAERLFSSVMVGSAALLVVVSTLLGLLAPYYLPVLGSGFGEEKLILARRILYLLLPFPVLSGIVAIWGSILNAGERFTLPAFTPILTPLVAVVFLVLGGATWGILALAAGTVVGSATEAGLLCWGLKAQGFSLKPRWYGMDSHVRQVAKQYLPMVIGSFLAGGSNMVDQGMAAMLQPGSVAALNYGKKTISAILRVGSVAVSTTALPYFSRMVANRDWEGCRKTLKFYSRWIVLATIPATLGLIFFSRPLISLLFERGAFKAADTKLVSFVQALYAPQIPFYILGIVLVRVLSSLKRNKLLMYVAGINLAADVLLNWIFMKFLGVGGIALSTSVVSFSLCLFLAFCVLRAINVALRPRPSDLGSANHAGL